MALIQIAVASPAHGTSIMVDGVPLRDVERFIMQQHAGDEYARLELTRVSAEPDPESPELARRGVQAFSAGENDIEIIGIADVVELFQDAARKAAAEQKLALGSFWIHEGSDPVLMTLGELLRDARRYRAIQRYVAVDDNRLALQTKGTRAFLDNYVTADATDLDKVVDGYLRGLCYLCQQPIDMNDTEGHGLGDCVPLDALDDPLDENGPLDAPGAPGDTGDNPNPDTPT